MVINTNKTVRSEHAVVIEKLYCKQKNFAKIEKISPELCERYKLSIQ